MSSAYPKELRQRVIQTYHEEDCTIDEVALRFKVGRATVTRWLARFRDTGSYDAMPHNGGLAHQKLHTEHRHALIQWLEHDPSLTQLELAQKLEQHFGLSVCQATVSNALRKEKWTFKKNNSG